MTECPNRTSECIGEFLAATFGVAMFCSFTFGLAILAWRDFGGVVAVPVFILSMALWLPRFLRNWRSKEHPRLTDEHSLFGASFECPNCRRERYHTNPCRCGHAVKKIEWEYPGRIKYVE